MCMCVCVRERERVCSLCVYVSRLERVFMCSYECERESYECERENSVSCCV